ncbi:hypothetical protein TcasGA2_TC010262 [Tribolium castaneum]|uniref:Uncharacterized protein n=1 Tax=Tribolium castaneum TaxID=7070 RepID=D7EJR8_TRICA|nr:hypothetical protein TcasGA2_TC010262 [Tribolium castaneum]
MESCPCLRLMSILHDIHGNVAHNGLALSLQLDKETCSIDNNYSIISTRRTVETLMNANNGVSRRRDDIITCRNTAKNKSQRTNRKAKHRTPLFTDGRMAALKIIPL